MLPNQKPEKNNLNEKINLPVELNHQEIRQQIESMDVDENLKTQLQSHSDDITPLEEQAKVQKLLEVARQKGVIFAVKVAQKMDPYILDTLHDALVKEGFYKDFKK